MRPSCIYMCTYILPDNPAIRLVSDSNIRSDFDLMHTNANSYYTLDQSVSFLVFLFDVNGNFDDLSFGKAY